MIAVLYGHQITTWPITWLACKLIVVINGSDTEVKEIKREREET